VTWPNLPKLDIMCAACLANAQVIAAGTMDDRPDLKELIREQDFEGRVEVIFKGQGLCARHFNLRREWPADYPDCDVDDTLKAVLVSRYESLISGETDGG
jgi:hypothetical protein